MTQVDCRRMGLREMSLVSCIKRYKKGKALGPVVFSGRSNKDREAMAMCRTCKVGERRAAKFDEKTKA